MSGELRIREATTSDAEAIARVHVSSWQGAYTHVFPAEALARLGRDMPSRTRQWSGWLADPPPRGSTFVAVRGDEVIGFVHGQAARDEDLDAERVAELLAIYVAPAAWGTGAGRRLMDEFLRRMTEAGFGECVLWVIEDNPRARGFYEAAGWALDGPPKEYELLGTMVPAVRYRIALSSSSSAA